MHSAAEASLQNSKTPLVISGNNDDFEVEGHALVEKDALEPAHLYMYEQCAMTAQPVSSSASHKQVRSYDN